MNFDIGEVLSRAWEITSKHKVLWAFGALASCTGGWSTRAEWDSNLTGSSSSLTPIPSSQFLRALEVVQNNSTIFLAVVIIVFCAIGIAVIFFSVIGRVGLIRSAAQAEDGSEKLIFRQVFSQSLPYFWRILGLFLLIGIPLVVLVWAIVRGIFVNFGDILAASEVQGGVVLVLLLFCGLSWLIPVGFVLSMILRQAERAIVFEELGMIPALVQGWKVFRSNPVAIIIMAIILGVVSFVVGFLFTVPIAIIVLLVSFAFGSVDHILSLIPLWIGFCLYLPLFLLLRGILVAYIESAWTLTYLRLTRGSKSQLVLLEAAPS